MKAILTTAAALAIATAVPAQAQEAAPPAIDSENTIASALETLQRVAVQYGVLMARSFIDLTYDGITVESGTGDLILSGLKFYPDLDWDEAGNCVISADGLRMANATSIETLGSAIAIRGVTVPAACLQPPAAATLAAFGYDEVAVDRVAIDVDYHVPSSSAEMTIAASVAGVADVTLWADFDYLWFRVPLAESDDPTEAAADTVPVARLSEAELVISNRGIWQAVAPMLAQQFGGDLSQAPKIAGQLVKKALSKGGHQLNEQETALVKDVEAELARFVAEQDRIVVTLSPEKGSVLLNAAMMESPSAAIAALDPTISGAPAAYARMISPEELAAALSGGDSLDVEARLRVGKALVTGIGAPRAVKAGQKLLAPLAKSWNAKAALFSARANQQNGNLKAAYVMALRAMAGGLDQAIGLADEIEADLPLVVVLNAQADVMAAWPGAKEAGAMAEKLISSGDIAGIVRLARAAAEGQDRPRNYADAYYWATLAAAAGDRGAVALRDRLDTRFAGQQGWAEAVGAGQKKALATWTGGLAATIAAGAE